MKAVARLAVAGVVLLAGCAGAVPLPDGDTAAFGTQICGGTGADPSAYLRTMPVLPGAAPRLSAAGSSLIGPMMSVWAQQYAGQHGTRVAYQPIGSGSGIAQTIAGTVALGATDTPMTSLERAKAGGRRLLALPVTLGGVVPAYHLAGIGAGLRFDADVLGAVFAGRIRRWDDPALRSLNPGLRLPARDIVVVHRADASGTTAVFTDYLTRGSPTWVSALGAGSSSGKQVVWPTGLAGKGNDGVAGMLAQVDGAVGYLELAYVLGQHLPYGQVRNRTGDFIQPCPATMGRAAQGIDLAADLPTSLADSTERDAYPITGVTYLLLYADQHDRATAVALVNFLAWMLTTGQDLAPPLGYGPLTARLQRDTYAQLYQVTADGAPVAPTG